MAVAQLAIDPTLIVCARELRSREKCVFLRRRPKPLKGNVVELSFNTALKGRNHSSLRVISPFQGFSKILAILNWALPNSNGSAPLGL
ncbi:MAG: hypothetical protein WCR52_18880 [Bacteroidota bacterium]